MSYPIEQWNFILCMTLLIIVLLGIGVFLFTYPHIMKKFSTNRKKKERKSNLFTDGDSLPILEEEDNFEMEDFIRESKMNTNTVIECSIEYRTRGSSLIVEISKISPSIFIQHYNPKIQHAKLYCMVYLNGDYMNIPCESTKKQIDTIVDVNEIFIFTVMPYDLPTSELVVQVILLSENIKYIIGIMKLPLYELDQRQYMIRKAFSLQFPTSKIVLPDCLLCLSITNSKNLIKVKIIRLNILDCSFPEEGITGLSLRLTMENPNKPPQIFDSTKKKYKSTLMFNETMIFETMDVERKHLQLKIELLESCCSNGNEIVTVRGCIEMNSIIFQENNFSEKWMEALDNLDTEIVQWYPISYITNK